MESNKFEWQQISRKTSRAKVIGGWLILDIQTKETRTPEFWATAVRKSVGNALCFVPDIDHKWKLDCYE